jgi:integrase
MLKAALNHAFHEGTSDEPWRKVKPFREAHAPVARYLNPDECVRLFNACKGAFRDLVRGALVTGHRFGELTPMRADDFNPKAGTVTVRISKAGKPRHVALAGEGKALFSALTAGRASQDLVFRRADGAAWAHRTSNGRLMPRRRSRSSIRPRLSTFLRHTYASSFAAQASDGRHRDAAGA